jgi:LytS/YehU family sensor histidine kinase
LRSKPIVGALTGTVLGLLDGLSAWAYPEARSTILWIVISSTLKGLLTGVLAGLVARRWRSMGVGIIAGLAIGLVLSALAAIPVAADEPARYFDIVLPGMLIGALVGFATQRYPRVDAGGSRSAARTVLAALVIPAAMSAQQPSADPLDRMQFLVGPKNPKGEIHEDVGFFPFQVYSRARLRRAK